MTISQIIDLFEVMGLENWGIISTIKEKKKDFYFFQQSTWWKICKINKQVDHSGLISIGGVDMNLLVLALFHQTFPLVIIWPHL